MSLPTSRQEKHRKKINFEMIITAKLLIISTFLTAIKESTLPEMNSNNQYIIWRINKRLNLNLTHSRTCTQSRTQKMDTQNRSNQTPKTKLNIYEKRTCRGEGTKKA